MATQLPAFYVDNVRLSSEATVSLRGNVVSDITSLATAKGFNIKDCQNIRAKNNKALRIRSRNSTSYGFYTQNCTDVLFIYNVTSRANVGFYFTSATTLNVYNMTTHNCNVGVETTSNGTFRNVAMSAYEDWAFYRNCTGFYLSPGTTVTLNYAIHTGLLNLNNGGTLNQGGNVEEAEILYIDEPADDLTPDHISTLVNSGTDNPLRTSSPCIGGIESEVTDEETPADNYQYELVDNSFWDINNAKSPEMSFIQAFRSRILANSELAERTVENNFYIKFATSVERFSELFPMAGRYANATKFKKRVMDVWYATQNAGALRAYQNSIGGYNLYPSFYRRFEDLTDAWIIASSSIDDDNWLLGMEELKYGMVIDVLGLSTLSQAASAECYKNTMECISDIAPVYWNLHHEAQPANYLLFTDLYNSFEDCTLTNMVYNDDFNINIDVVQQDGRILTPLISTDTVASSGSFVELSTLDRVYSENITRNMYYRQGPSLAAMGAWQQVTNPIGEIIRLSSDYIQFRIEAEDVLRQIDYEFMGLCLRPYSSARVWTPSNSDLEDAEVKMELTPGGATLEGANPAVQASGGLTFAADGVNRNAAWSVYIPLAFRTADPVTMRFFFAGPLGTARVQLQFLTINESSGAVTTGTLTTHSVTVSNITYLGSLGFTVLDVELQDQIGTGDNQLLVSMYRDSDTVGDNMAGTLILYGARTLEG